MATCGRRHEGDTFCSLERKNGADNTIPLCPIYLLAIHLRPKMAILIFFENQLGIARTFQERRSKR